jgi:hypothetical protein
LADRIFLADLVDQTAQATSAPAQSHPKSNPLKQNKNPNSKSSTAHHPPTHSRDPAMEPPPAKRAKVAAVPVGETPMEPLTQETFAPRGTLFSGKVVYFPHIDKKDPDFDRAKLWIEQDGGKAIHEFDAKYPTCDFTVLPHGFTLGEAAPGVLVSPNYIIVCGSVRSLLPQTLLS